MRKSGQALFVGQSHVPKYGAARAEPEANEHVIIGAVLNYGTKTATDWVLSLYGIAEVRQTAQAIASYTVGC